MSRADFAPDVQKVIGGRSGYRCSYPGCSRITIGPGASASETASIGVAAHIFSAAQNGPRGTGGLSDAERQRPENGIWLCADHARLVDTNQGKLYPPELLLSYKSLHEARVVRDMTGTGSSLGWFQELRIANSPVFVNNTLVRLAKLSLVVGNNLTGKTALCQWLAGFADPRQLGRWLRPGNPRYPIDVSLSYYNPDPTTLGMVVTNDGQVTYSQNGTRVPFNTNPMKVLFPLPIHEMRDVDDLQMFARSLSLDERLVVNLCDTVQEYEHSTVRNIRFAADEEGTTRLYADVHGTYPGLSFDSLSGSEQERVFVELAVAAARTYARHQPTLLILDGSVTIFREDWFEFYSHHFSDPNNLFQTIIVIPTRGFDATKLSWLGWEVVRTCGEAPNVRIEQSIRP